MGQDRYTLLDIARQQDPDGTIAEIAEVLQQHNPMLQDGPAYPSNAQMGHRTTMRSSLPAVTWSRINQGYTKSKSATEQRVDTIGLLTGMSEVDSKMKKIIGAGNFNMHRAKEDDSFLEAMSQEVAGTALYGNELTESVAFTGLQPRLQTLNTAITGSQVRAHHSAPSGSDYSSIYVADWGPRGAHFIYPKESVAGLDARDLGEQRVTDADGLPMMAYVMVYEWLVGLAVEDPRRIARLCNIDISQALADTTTKLVDSLIRLLNGMPQPMGHSRVLYCHRDIYSAFEIQVNTKSNIWFSWQDYLEEKTLHFRGYPIRIMDQMSAAESLVS